MFRIATWNVNSIRVRLEQVLQWLEVVQPDVLGLQETKVTDPDFPLAEFVQAGYTACFSGQKSYNGVAVLSKHAMTNVVTDFPQFVDPQRRVLGGVVDGVFVFNLYVPNGSEVGSEKYLYKLEWLEHLQKFTESLVNQYEHVILLGDFNIAPEDRDVHDPIAWTGKVLVSAKERAAFFGLLQHSLVDCFRLFNTADGLFSWWDYRMAGFQRNHGVRIDHILATDSLAELGSGCFVDMAPRGLQRPSDHAPVVADFDL